MAGTIFGMGLSQQIGATGRPLGGALLYLYQTNTSTPVDAFSDFALSSIHQWPIEADSAGRLPAFWLDDGTYRVRLTTSAGVTVFDEQAITAIGPSSGDSGGSAAIDTETIHQTGDMIWNPVSATRTGWIRCNGRTISSGSGSGTERANGDCSAVFDFLWNNFADSICAVSGGRGASSTADFNANKAIATLDMRGCMGAGLDDMGNSAASVITGGTTGGAPGTTAGSQTASVTVGQANLPNVSFTVSGTAATHTHSVSGNTGSQSAFHTHTFSGTTASNGAHSHSVTGADSKDVQSGGSAGAAEPATKTTSTDGAHTHTFTGTTDVEGVGNPHLHAVNLTSGASGALTLTATAASGGSGTAISTNNLPPYRCGSWYMKL